MTQIKFFVPGEPLALKRHRTGRFGTYDPSKGDKMDFLTIAMQHRPKAPFDVPLCVDMEFVFRRPKTHYGTGKNGDKLKPSAPYYHASKPDFDNLEKFVCDALNRTFWRDDSIIAMTSTIKRYAYHDEVPGVFIRINSAGNLLP